ncbi:MAG TPA: hypothetical protein VKX46_04010 [Ktedonobacteraceae bacterium]|nr:hypothetical protein [Ktedonobacteraceae bacterium]
MYTRILANRRFLSLFIFCTLSFVFLFSACSTQVGMAGANNTPLPKPTVTSAVPTGTPPVLQAGGFTENDSGKTYTDVVTSRFSIVLDRNKYPKDQLHVLCSPAGTIGSISNVPPVAPPLYAVRYQGVQPGRCIIQNGTFILYVHIIALTR